MQQDRSILILVVDDEPPIIDLLQRLGQDIFPQAQFVSTDSPQQTLDYLADTDNKQPQLILLDVDLHNSLNGIDLIPQIRNQLREPAPIVMFSVSDAQPDIERSYEAGAVAYTRKPENLEEWKRYVNVLKTYWYTTSRLPGATETRS
jgi:CheY-like chemotaxis protein